MVIEWWGPKVDEFLWGWIGCCATWRRPDGSFDPHDVDWIHPEGSYSDPGWNWDGFADWLEPGRMGHASLDRWATRVTARNENPPPGYRRER